MSGPTPHLLAKRLNGVLANQATSDSPRPSKARGSQGEKIVIRRLPPGLTEDEFWTILGEEWKADKSGKGKTDWTDFIVGKSSRE